MNVLKCFSSLLLIGAILVVLPSFKRKSKQLEIPNLPEISESADYAQTKQGITLQAKKLSKPEAEQILGKRAERLWHQSTLRKTRKRKRPRPCRKRGVQRIVPIQLSFKNQTTRPITLCNENIGLSLANGNEVAKRLSRSPLTAAAGTAIACGAIMASLGTVAYALGFVLAVGCCGSKISPILLSAAYIGFCTTIAGVSGTILATPVVTTGNAMTTRKENRRARKAVKKHNFANKFEIEPGKKLDTLIFVAEDDYKETFDLKVERENSLQSVPFTVTLQDRDLKIA